MYVETMLVNYCLSPRCLSFGLSWMSDKSSSYVLNLRGLPYSTKEAEVASFFTGVNLREIHLLYTPDGLLQGEAYIVVGSENDLQSALLRNGGVIGDRFIEIRRSSLEQMNWYLNRRPKPDGTLRLFGLPFSVTKAQIQAFFEGFEIVKDGIGLLTDHHGRPTGEAFVQFVSPEVARLAAGKHKHLIDGRYVEISFSTLRAANQAIERQMYINMGMVPPDPKSSTRTWTNPYWMKRPLPSGNPSSSPQTSPQFPNTSFTSSFGQSQLGCRPFFSAILEAAGLAYCAPVVEQNWVCQYPAPDVNGCNVTYTMPTFDSQSSTGASRTQRHIRMRGLPFAATVNDILDFFRPIQPLTVTMRAHKNGKPNGMADVYFATVEDTREAMKRHKAPMGFRYIELFSSVHES